MTLGAPHEILFANFGILVPLAFRPLKQHHGRAVAKLNLTS